MINASRHGVCDTEIKYDDTVNKSENNNRDFNETRLFQIEYNVCPSSVQIIDKGFTCSARGLSFCAFLLARRHSTLIITFDKEHVGVFTC